MHFTYLITLAVFVILQSCRALRFPTAIKGRASPVQAQYGSDRRYVGEDMSSVATITTAPPRSGENAVNIMYKFSRPHTIKVRGGDAILRLIIRL